MFKMFLASKSLLFTVIYLICFQSFTQNSDYFFKNLSHSQGLSQNSVIAMHQDKLGQMWFGTRDGLNKYDGSEFKVYRNSSKDSLSISNDNILSIEEDSEGFIWVGTFNGVNKYDPIKNKFTRYLNGNGKNYLGSNTVWSIKEINNEIWIGSTNGLSIYNKTSKQLKKIAIHLENKTKNSDYFITKILKTKNGTIWVGTLNGLLKLEKRDNNNFFFTSLLLEKNKKTEVKNLKIQDLLETKNGTIWVATKTNGVLIFNNKTISLTKPIENKFNKAESKDCRALSLDLNGNLWVGTNTGLYIYKPNGKIILSAENESLNKIKSIYTDSNNSIWIGSYYGGVNFWDKNNLNFKNIHSNDFNKTLNYNVVSSITSDNKKNIYIGTEGDGITVLDSLNKKVRLINKEIESNYIKSLLLFKNKYLLTGTFANGIVAYDIINKKKNNNFIPKSLTKKIEKTSVYSIIKENESVIWIGTFGKGLIRLNTIKKTFKTYEYLPKKKNFLTSNRVRNILTDSKNRLWVATQKGLNLLNLDKVNNLKQQKIKHFFYNSKTNSGLDILTIYEDTFKNIWVGTKAEGLYKYQNNKFVKVAILSIDNNYKVKSIHAITEGNDNNLWLSSNQGILKYNYKSKKLITYNQKDGILANEFNDNAVLKIENTFYFGGPSGVTFFDEKNIQTNKYSPKVILTDFKVENQPVVIEKKGILQKHISYTESIYLGHKNANFSISFSKPNFINSSSNLYKYRLLGLQDEWITSTKNDATYTIQKAGNYIFEVKGANNDLVWNETPTKLKIRVLPSPWKSWWAFLIYFILMFTSMLILLWFLKSKTKLKHELELEHIENERKEELNKSKLEFFTNISHEFRTPLTLILGPLQQILLDYSGSNKMYKKLLIVENNANHLLQLINRLMNFRKLETNQDKIETAQGNIVKFIKEIYFSFTEHAKNRGYTYTLETSNDEILVYYDRIKLERVLYNLISNAFKYTPKGGIVKLNIFTSENNIIIEVEDNGVGISKEYVDKIFNRFFEVSSFNNLNDNYNQSTGIGLSIVKKMIDLHKGEVSVKNKIDKGAIFSVKLPLGRDHLTDNEILNDFKISDDISQYKSQLQESEFDDTIDELLFDKDKQTILIVEDHKPLRSFIKNLLKKDYNIIEAENGSIALKKANENLPNLIISDVVMPVMVGTELCSKIKGNMNTSHIPVILLTSRSSLIYRLEGLENGADEYISKPFNIKEFVLKIKNILSLNDRLKHKFTNDDGFLAEEVTVSSIDEKLLKEAYRIVEENISNDQFDIPYFSSELGVSRTMLFMKIKAWSNLTPLEFIQNIRMKKAAKLIETRKYNISQVCYKIGFKNPKYFGKKFREKYGLSPSEYQKKFFEDLNS